MARLKMQNVKNIVLIAHDSRKKEPARVGAVQPEVLKEPRLFATGTTGALIGSAPSSTYRYKSGPSGAISRSGQDQ